jgi:uncharacterized protein YaiL (DUF2058 family)
MTQYQNFKKYSTKKEERMQLLKSADEMEAVRAQTQLYELENKIKLHNDNYLSNMQNTASRA